MECVENRQEINKVFQGVMLKGILHEEVGETFSKRKERYKKELRKVSSKENAGIWDCQFNTVLILSVART